MWCAFASNPIVVLIGSINTRRNAARGLEDEVTNVGALPDVPWFHDTFNAESLSLVYV